MAITPNQREGPGTGKDQGRQSTVSTETSHLETVLTQGILITEMLQVCMLGSSREVVLLHSVVQSCATYLYGAMEERKEWCTPQLAPCWKLTPNP